MPGVEAYFCCYARVIRQQKHASFLECCAEPPVEFELRGSEDFCWVLRVSFTFSIDFAASGFQDVPEFAKIGGRGVGFTEEDGCEDLCVSELLQEGDGRNWGGGAYEF